MKTRSDFVSNSSSCSFFVEIKTEEDAKAFVEAAAELSKLSYVTAEVFSSLEDIYDNRWKWPAMPAVQLKLDSARLAELIVPGCYVRCDAGDDHFPGYEERYYSMENVFSQAKHKLKLYADPEAHMTAYDDLPEEASPSTDLDNSRIVFCDIDGVLTS